MKPINRLAKAMASICLALSAAATLAADYPSKIITIVVAYPAGGPVDAIARALGQRLSEEWKQRVIVDNRPGANESIAAQYVAKAPADGHTLFLATEGPLTMNQFLYKQLPYNPEKDFTPISRLITVPMALVVPANSPSKTIQEFVSRAKSRSAAGKPLAYGSAGVGGVTHLPMAMLAQRNNLEMVHVPYRGAAPLIPDIVSGQVDGAFLAVSAVAPFVKDGRMKALVVSAYSRSVALPNTPVFRETPVKDVQADFLMGLVGPAGMPSAVTEKIASTSMKIITEASFKEKFLDPYGYMAVASSPTQFANYLSKDRHAQAERVRVSGAKLD